MYRRQEKKYNLTAQISSTFFFCIFGQNQPLFTGKQTNKLVIIKFNYYFFFCMYTDLHVHYCTIQTKPVGY